MLIFEPMYEWLTLFVPFSIRDYFCVSKICILFSLFLVQHKDMKMYLLVEIMPWKSFVNPFRGTIIPINAIFNSNNPIAFTKNMDQFFGFAKNIYGKENVDR